MLAQFVRALLDAEGRQIDSFTAKYSEAVTAALIDVAASFGIVKRGSGALAHPEHSRYMLECILQYLDAHQPILGDLTTKGDRPWVQVLGTLESARTFVKPHRRANVAQAVITGVNSNARYVLVEFDVKAWKRFKLVGGKESTKEGALLTIQREMSEEIQRDVNDILILAKQPIADVTVDSVSRTVGARTVYTIVLFALQETRPGALNFSGELGPSLKWLAVDDLQWGLQNTPECFFADTLGHPVVLDHISTKAPAYSISDEELSARQVTKRPSFEWDVGR